MRIQLPLETWMAILDWLQRRELADRVHQLWDSQLTPIVQHSLHEWRRNVQIRPFELDRGQDGQAVMNFSLWETQPIAEVEMPTNITGFHKIKIGYLDPTIMEFLRRMQRIIRSVHFEICAFPDLPSQWDAIGPAFAHLLPLICQPIESIITNHLILEFLFRHFPLAISNTNLLSVNGSEINVNCLQMLINWLFTPRGHPRVLLYYLKSSKEFRELFAAVKERFLSPTRLNTGSSSGNHLSPPFFVRAQFYNSDGLELEDYNKHAVANASTGEQLRVRKVDGVKAPSGVSVHTFLISICAVNMEPGWLATKEREVLDWKPTEKKRYLQLSFPKLGPEMLESSPATDPPVIGIGN